MLGGVPSSSRRPASAPIAVIVPMVSKKSASISVKTSNNADTTPTDSNEPKRLNSPSVPKSGVSTILSGHSGTFRLHPVGPSWLEPRSPIASTTIATTVVARMEMRMAPLTFRTQSATTRTRPIENTTTGQPWSAPPGPS